MKTTITVIGTGAIGASIGLALKEANVPVELIGHDRLLERARQAKALGAFDRVEWNLIRAVEPADLVVLAVPPSAVLPTLQAIREDLRPGTVVTDTVEVKAPVLAWAAETLPHNVHFVGGHPLVRVAETGPQAAWSNLFRGRRYCVVPAPDADEKAVETVVRLVHHLGATPFFLDAAEHDALVTGVHHLPALTILAIARLLVESPSWKDLDTLADGLFAHVATLVEMAPADLRAFSFANREHLVHWLGTLQDELGEWVELLREGREEAFEERVTGVQDALQRWRESQRPPEWYRHARERASWTRMLGFRRFLPDRDL